MKRRLVDAMMWVIGPWHYWLFIALVLFVLSCVGYLVGPMEGR